MKHSDADYSTAWRWLLPAFPAKLFLGDASVEASFRALCPPELTPDPAWALIDARALGHCEQLPPVLSQQPAQHTVLFGPDRVVAAAMSRLGLSGQRMREYGLLPAHAPRVVVPLSSARDACSGLDLHTPGSWKGKVGVAVLRRLAGLGIVQPLRRSLLVVVSMQDWQPWALCGLGPSQIDGRNFALYLGAQGPERKTVALPIESHRRGGSSFIIKSAESPRARTKLANEANMLALLAQTSLAAQVPTKLSFDERGSVSVLVQQRFKGKRPGGAAQAAAVQMFLRTALCIGRTSVPLHEHVDGAPASMEGVREQLFRKLCERHATTELPIALTHGDFAPWNFAVVDRALVVYDWEEGCAAGIPLDDAFSYVVSPALLIAKQYNPAVLVSRALAFAEQTYTAAGVGRDGMKAAFALWCLMRSESFFPDVLTNAARLVIEGA